MSAESLFPSSVTRPVISNFFSPFGSVESTQSGRLKSSEKRGEKERKFKDENKEGIEGGGGRGERILFR